MAEQQRSNKVESDISPDEAYKKLFGTEPPAAVESNQPASQSEVQLPAMEAGGPKMVAPDEAYLPARKVSEGDMGLQRAYFGAFNKSILSLPDLALNIVALGAEQVGLLPRTSNDPQENRNILERFFNAANYEQRDALLKIGDTVIGSLGKGKQIKPETLGEKIAAGAGEGTSLATAMPFLAARAAAAGAEGAYTAAPMAEGIRQRALQPKGALGTIGPMSQQMAADYVAAFANAPARTTAAELLTGATSGAAGTAEQEITGYRTGLGDLAGGFLPNAIVWTARTAYKWAPTRNIIKYGSQLIPGSPGEKVMEANARKEIAQEMYKSFQEAKDSGQLERANAILKQLEEAGYPIDLSAAELTQTPSLRRAQINAQSSATPDEARAFRERIEGNVSKIINYSNDPNLIDPEAPTAVITQLQSAADEEARLQALGLEKLSEFGENVAGRLPMTRSRAEQGATIRKALIDAKETKKVELDQLAADLGINETNPGTLMNPVKKHIRDTYYLGNDTDRYLPKVIRDFADSEENVINFQTWKRYRDKTSDELAAAIANKQSSDVVNLTKFKEDLDKFGNMFYASNKNWNTFKNRYYEEYAKPFERGVAYEVATPSPASRPGDVRYLTSDEAVADAFSRNVENANDFMNLYKDKPEAVNSMRAVILDGARERVIAKSGPYEGTVDPTKLNTFINQNREVLDVLGLKGDLESVENAAKLFGMRAAELKDRAAVINKDKVNRLLSNITDGKYSPDEFIDVALKDPKTMTTIAKRVSEAEDPNLTEALKKAVWTRIFATNDINDPGRFMEFAKNNERTLKIALGDEHYKRMLTAAEAMGLAKYAQEGAEGLPLEALSGLEKFAKYTGITPASLANAVAAAGRGQVKEKYLAFAFAFKFLSARQRASYDKVMREVLVDPEIAKELASEVGGDGLPTQKQANKMKGILLRMGLQPDGKPYEEERPVENVPVPKELFLGEGEIRKPEAPSGLESLPPFLNQPLPQKATPNVTVTFPESNPSSSNPFNQPAPVAPPPQNGANRVDYQSLFPNDPLGTAINNRSAQQ